jgi:hypothetical protein
MHRWITGTGAVSRVVRDPWFVFLAVLWARVRCCSCRPSSFSIWCADVVNRGITVRIFLVANSAGCISVLEPAVTDLVFAVLAVIAVQVDVFGGHCVVEQQALHDVGVHRLDGHRYGLLRFREVAFTSDCKVDLKDFEACKVDVARLLVEAHHHVRVARRVAAPQWA